MARRVRPGAWPAVAVRLGSSAAARPRLSRPYCPPVACKLSGHRLRVACGLGERAARAGAGSHERKLGKVSELVYLDFGAVPVGYLEGWDLQRRVHARRVADPGAPVIDGDRGGKITWHGPGQLTGYPIIKPREPLDVVAYVRALEEAMIRACAEFGVTTARVE